MAGRGGGGHRTPSGPWSRLKPTNLDTLENYGLPSKGDNRLLDHKTQERYYTKIVDRFMSFCSSAGHSGELLRRMSSLSIEPPPSSSNTAIAQDSRAPPPNSSNPSISTSSLISFLSTTTSLPTLDDNTSTSNKTLHTLLFSLRKLREGLTASHRIDTLTLQIYIFSIRLSILLCHHESYHPALLHLLRVLHPVCPLSSLELNEMSSYLILDLACRQRELGQAYATQNYYTRRGVRGDSKMVDVLRALVHDDYELFWRVKRSVDGHKARIMEFAEEWMRMHALKCLGRTYLSIQMEFLERSTGGCKWGWLVEKCGVGWELQGQKVIIRKSKGS